MTHMFREGL